MKLLQIPSVALEQRIKQEIEENPALEEMADEDDFAEETKESDDFEDEDNADSEVEEYDSTDDEFDLDDYLDDDEITSYKLSSGNNSGDNERKDIPFASALSFQDMLMSQLGLRSFSEQEMIIAENIIGSLDDSGYLNRDINAMVDDLAFSQNIQTTRDEILGVLKVIQELDPAGVGARDLQECLLIQLYRKDESQ